MENEIEPTEEVKLEYMFVTMENYLLKKIKKKMDRTEETIGKINKSDRENKIELLTKLKEQLKIIKDTYEKTKEQSLIQKELLELTQESSKLEKEIEDLLLS